MNKKKLFVDFDGTITDSARAFCDAYNLTYCNKDNFTPADYTKVNRYDLADQCTLVSTQEKVREIFACYEFWSWLDFMDGAKNALEKLNEKYELFICSIGTNLNLSRKAKWIERYLPFIKKCILINNGNNTMDKSIIDMSGGILIDDVAKNLVSSNAECKICFGKIHPWNEELPNDCVRAETWSEVENYI
jgi:5'(3')-deoxyribonucleotidase